MKRISLVLPLAAASSFALSLLLLIPSTASAQLPACALPWQVGMSVSVGQMVSFGGHNFKAILPEASAAPNWLPPNLPALWSDTGPCATGTCAALPGAPGGLAASSISQTFLDLSWTASTTSPGCTVTQYDIVENGGIIGSTSGTSFHVNGLTPAISFVFSVFALNAAGQSPQSVPVTVRTPANGTCTQKPSTLFLTAAGTTSSSTVLHWNVSDPISVACLPVTYTVFENGHPITTFSGAPVFTVNGLTPATTFLFTVTANNPAGSSPQSNAVSVTTLPPNTGGGGNGRLLIGYWHNFNNNSVNLPLGQVSSNFDVINVAFGETTRDTSTISFAVDLTDIESQAQFITDVQTLHGKGKKVLLSIGGQNGNVTLLTAQDVNNFVNSTSDLMRRFGFDGVDIDIENNSFSLVPGDNDFMNPKTPTIVNMIAALHRLASQFPGFMLSFAPQIEDVQEANIAFVSVFGDQLPLLWGCRDILSYVHVQDYNSGGTNALDGRAYNQGTADFHVAMTELLLKGFTLANGQVFPGFPPSQVAFGVPASSRAASGGFTAPGDVQKALNYLITGKSFGGQYVLQNPGGYPDLRGVMTWSVNWDQVNGFGLSNTLAPFLHGLPAIPSPK